MATYKNVRLLFSEYCIHLGIDILFLFLYVETNGSV